MRERLTALLLSSNGKAQIIAPSFEVTSYSKNTWIREFIPWAEDENPFTVLVNRIDTKNNGLYFMFDDSLPLGIFWALQEALGSFRETSAITFQLNAMRILKTKEEIECMKKAGQIINKAVMQAFREAKIGLTELELSQIVNFFITKEGAQPSFAIVQFGENSALPHTNPGNRKLRVGDVMLMDCGCAVEGYNTDMTRVGIMGEPTEEQERVYSIVLQAQETAIAKIQSGMACGKVDGIARHIIEEAGYGEHFTHRLGHGVGIEVHEEPYIVRGNSKELRSGMCHSIEPGIYLEGKFGVRIEDLVCITDSGAELLTFAPKELITVQPS
jgi:Xaa-Pro dipeptidase